MTIRNFVIVDGDDAPGIVLAGSGSEYGHIEMEEIRTAHNLAMGAFKRTEDLTSTPDTIATLRVAVNNLSDAISAISGQLMQLEVGIRSGRIAVTERE